MAPPLDSDDSEDVNALTSSLAPANSLTDKQKSFIKFYSITRNATKAALQAGLTSNSASARVLGARMLKTPAVAALIEKAIAGLGDSVAMQSDPTLAALVEMRDFCARGVMEANPTLKELADKLTDEELRCIGHISIKRWQSESGSGESIVLKPVNRLLAACALAKVALHRDLTKIVKQETESEIKAQLRQRMQTLAAAEFPEEDLPRESGEAMGIELL